MTKFFCISYLLDKIYHYIKIILMISWLVIMLLFSHYQKLSQLGVKISYNVLIDSPQIINGKVLFAVHICLVRSTRILTSLMISWIVLMLLILHYQNLSQLGQGVKILYDILTPPLSSSNAFDFYTTKTYPNLARGWKYCMIFWHTPF